MKFLLLSLSAVHRLPFRPTKKNYPDFAPPSDLRHPTWGQSYTMFFFFCNEYIVGSRGASQLGGYKHVLILSIEYGQEKFIMVGRSVGQRGVGRRRALLNGGRTEVLTSL